jgi:hypothetical protein
MTIRMRLIGGIMKALKKNNKKQEYTGGEQTDDRTYSHTARHDELS